MNALNAACDKFLYDRLVPFAHDRILEAADCVKRLFVGKVVKRARIDKEMGLSKPATLKWLKRARDAGLIEFDEVDRGWVPASIADGRVFRSVDPVLAAADCVKRLFDGVPVHRSRIDVEIEFSKSGTLKWLRRARAAGLIEYDEIDRGWRPAVTVV